jgi:hypothetical protein
VSRPDDEQLVKNTQQQCANIKQSCVNDQINKYIYILCSSDKIVVRSSHRKSSPLKDFLMFKKAVSTGVYKCKEGCVLCRDYLHQGESLDLKNRKSLKTNERFDCLSRNVLHAAKCSGCKVHGRKKSDLSDPGSLHKAILAAQWKLGLRARGALIMSHLNK